jgi:hypothetical protein
VTSVRHKAMKTQRYEEKENNESCLYDYRNMTSEMGGGNMGKGTSLYEGLGSIGTLEKLRSRKRKLNHSSTSLSNFIPSPRNEIKKSTSAALRIKSPYLKVKEKAIKIERRQSTLSSTINTTTP